MKRARLEIGYDGRLHNNAPFKIDPLDILCGLDWLSGPTRGSLVQLLIWQHQNCGWLDDDDAFLAKLLRIRPSTWRKQRAELEQALFVTSHEFRGRIVFHYGPQHQLLERA